MLRFAIRLLSVMMLCWSAAAHAQSAGDLFRQGTDAIRNKNFAEAEKLLKQAAELEPTNWEIHRELGRVYFNANRFTEAAGEFRLATDNNPSFVLGLYNMAFAYRKGGDCKNAIEAYQRYLSVKQNDPDAYYGMADCMMTEKRYDDALAAFGKYVELEQRPTEQKYVAQARAKMDEIRGLMKAPQASVRAQGPARAAVAKKELAPALARSGDDHLKNGFPFLAARSYQEALRHDPKLTGVQLKLGDAWAKAGDYSKAKAAWDKVLEQEPKNQDAKARADQAEERLANYGKPGKPGFRVNKEEGDAIQFLMRGQKAESTEDMKEALSLYNQAIARDHRLAGAWAGRGSVHLAMKRNQLAAHDYTIAVSLDGENPSNLYGLASAYKALREDRLARKYFQKFLDAPGPKRAPQIEAAKAYLEGGGEDGGEE
ncbi:MAG: Lipopolysaccharide assembly protein B [Myxococcota bacterium]|nr:Lipopolysaccharide assembly protein B [Myxococcota bacterium]